MRAKRARAFTLMVLTAAGLLGCGDESDPAPRSEVTVMTFNVLCSFCSGDYDPWDERLSYFGDIFERHDPDLLGLQELTWPDEVDELLALRPGFAAVYFEGDEPGPLSFTDYPDATILYRTARFSLQERGSYWLSPTPEQAWSAGFADGQLPRLVAWARLRESETGRDLLFVTTHVDNNTPSQEKSAPLILERTEPWALQMPVLMTGDFNSQTYDPAYEILVEGADGQGFHFENAFDFAQAWSIDTNQDPVPEYDVPGRIDHIFVAGEGARWTCPQWTVDMRVYGDEDRYPSDHRAIVAELTF